MKILLSFAILATMVLALASVSAITACTEATIVSGTVYEGDISNGVSGADVDVTCSHNGTNTTESTTSLSNGEYSVTFDCGECDYGDNVVVSASKDSKSGEEDGSITITYGFCGLTLNIGVVNVPLIPEFGIAIGALTMASAIVAFFVIRRK